MDFPEQVASHRRSAVMANPGGSFDMREHLKPRRLTLAMWDQAFVLRHGPGGSFADFDRVLAETVERGYNTVRLDPMPQWIDLSRPETPLHWPDPQQPYMPWDWNTAVDGPVGQWIIEFMEKLLRRGDLYYTLSAWWFCKDGQGPTPRRVPRTHVEAGEMWIDMLRHWQKRFGFDRLVYVDLANEVPYFLPGFQERFKTETGAGWHSSPVFSAAQVEFLTKELNSAMWVLQREFPQLRFTASIHGDLRWLDVPVNFDCLDVHFYADADKRWTARSAFFELSKGKLFTQADWHQEFSDRCQVTAASIAPMLRAAQRHKLAQFAAWSAQRGMPLTTSESWASWFYVDSPGLDWGWLLDWASWSVDDAIEFGMWGWTPHNYVQPQFANWQQVRWHQQLTEKFLRS